MLRPIQTAISAAPPPRRADASYDTVDRFSGSISAEHGIGSLKRDKLEHHKSPVALNAMRAIKLALDPHNLLNPGRVLKL